MTILAMSSDSTLNHSRLTKMALPRSNKKCQSSTMTAPRRMNLLSSHSSKASHNREQLLATLVSKGFEWTETLGEGASGLVLAASFKNPEKRMCAIKCIQKDRIPLCGWRRDRSRGMLPLEVFILSRLSHSSIIGFLDVFEDSKYFYLVTEIHGHPTWLPGNDRKEQLPSCIIDCASGLPSPAPSCSCISGSMDSSTLPPLTVPLFSADETCHSGPRENDAWLTPGAEFSPAQDATRSLPSSPVAIEKKSPMLKKLKRSNSRDLFEFCTRRRHALHPTSHSTAFLTPTQIQHIFSQICQALYYLHTQHNLAHLDLRDENIVIDDSLVIKLVDFGSARFLTKGDPKELYEFRGSLHFAPPEVLNCILSTTTTIEGFSGKPVDMWSLGLLLHLLLFSSLPFESHLDLLKYTQVHANYTLSSQSTLHSRWAPELHGLLLGLLDFDPRSRWTIQDVVNHPWVSALAP